MLLTREWSLERGVTEHETALASFSQLLDLCLDTDGRLPDRVTLTGTDRDGRERSVSFSFAASVTRKLNRDRRAG